LQVFQTAGLIVRQFNMNDADAFYLINSNENVMRYIRPVKTRQQSDIFLEENILHYSKNAQTGRWAVQETGSGNIIGMFSLLPVEGNPGKLHIGYALLPAYWGKGYATTLLKQGVKFFFNHYDETTLYAITRNENVASEKVLQKCGFIKMKSFGENENLWALSKSAWLEIT